MPAPRSAVTTPTVRPDPDTLPPAQAARRTRIVDAAVELLAASDYDAVQMRDVAERAGVALGTLYRYFSSKEHLYAAALVRWASDYGPRGRRTATDATDRADASVERDEELLRALMRRAVRAFERAPQMLRAQMILEQSADPNARALYDAFVAHNREVLTSALEHLDGETARDVIMTVNCVMSNHLRAWAHGRATIRDVDRAVQRCLDLVFGPPPT